jgi:cell wall-associated NlpC family hydrolase
MASARREIALKIAWRMYGLPYIWGGDDAVGGFDCSGMVVEILQSVGILPSGDWTAAGLWRRFVERRTTQPIPGTLVFWANQSGGVRHVEMCIGEGLSIGASGGGSRIRTRADAVEANAFVKVRPIEGRGRVLAFMDPF